MGGLRRCGRSFCGCGRRVLCPSPQHARHLVLKGLERPPALEHHHEMGEIQREDVDAAMAHLAARRATTVAVDSGRGPTVWRMLENPRLESPLPKLYPPPMPPIYKLCPEPDWHTCQRTGSLPWSPVDTRDGFIHLSAPHQVQVTAAKHFRSRTGLVLLEIDPARLPEGALRWEVSRNDERFPHLYADLPAAAVVRATAAPLDENGVPRLDLPASDPT